jgi:hypothetical protein
MSDGLQPAIAGLCGRLAGLLAALPGDHVKGGVHFLREVHAQGAAPGAPDPLAHLDLSPVERDIIVLAGLTEDHEGFSAVFRILHPHGEPRPSAGLAAQLFASGSRTAFRMLLQSGRPASLGLLRINGSGPFFERSLELSDRIWTTLRGADDWPSSLSRTVQIASLAGLEEWLAESQVCRAVRALGNNESCTILVTAVTEELAFERGLALAKAAGRIAAGTLDARLTDDLRASFRGHCLLRRHVPVLLASPPDGPASAASAPPSFEGYPGAAIVCGKEGSLLLRCDRPVLSVSAERLLPTARKRMWQAAIPTLNDQQAAELAIYTIEPAAASELSTDMACLSRLEARAIEPSDLPACLRARSALIHSAGVKLIHPTADWDSLVLPTDREELLRDAVSRLAYQEMVFDQWGFLRGRPGARGVRMLFAGPPGTGKTYSAEVLANELSRDLLLVDISRVVSKWIGETEKNLATVFDTAERAHAVCFFDEADALFGRRTEVSDAHDRYANLETAYLLSRLDRFEGLAILATNLRQNIDPAFLRRMEFVVDFDEPDLDERYRLWRCHIPDGMDLDTNVNLYELATLYAVAGGFIRNAAVAAAFMAAADGGRISRNHLLRAVRREYTKAGRPFPGVPAGTRL